MIFETCRIHQVTCGWFNALQTQLCFGSSLIEFGVSGDMTNGTSKSPRVEIGKTPDPQLFKIRIGFQHPSDCHPKMLLQVG
jgi:hypothetical protein